MIGGFDEHPGHQVGVSPQRVDALLGGGAVHLDAISRGAQQEPWTDNTHTQPRAILRRGVSQKGEEASETRKIITVITMEPQTALAVHFTAGVASAASQ